MIRRIAGVLVAAALLPGCVVTHTEVVRVRHAGDTATTGSSASSASAAPSSHVVSRGETLYSIAFRAGMDWRDVAARNGLTPPYTIYPGQRLQLGGQPAVSTAGTASPSPSTAVMKPLEPGSVEVRPIGDVAATPPPSGATSPRTPPASSGGIQPAPPAASAPVATPPPVSQPVASTPSPVVSTPPAPPPTTPAATPAPSTPAPAAPVANAPTNNAGGVRWRWPTQGDVIQRFTGSDLTRPGIAIAGQSGQAVVAAADGEVVYSGSGLRGYGELIIIKHSPEFLSAYGHNRKRLVNEGQQVRAGQPIAELGRTGTDRDKLHFEIRRGGSPVDPLQFLPRQ